MSMTFSPLFSSSSGNSLYVSAGEVAVLVDAGGTGAAVQAALDAIDVSAGQLDAILITHEHADHIKGAGVLSRKFDIPIFANHATWRAMQSRIGDIAQKNIREFNQSFYIQDLLVEPYSIPHDAADPVCYALSYGSTKLATLTDLGHATKRLLAKLQDANVVLLEANHDEHMLKFGKYPQYLKRRILGTRGHLSNHMAAKAAYDLVTYGVKGIMLAHLSEQNNTPEAAFETVENYLKKHGVEPGKHVALNVLKRQCDAFVYQIGDKDNG